ncbi:hypothetical protein SRRS_13730 [Sporomusa rhizae]
MPLVTNIKCCKGCSICATVSPAVSVTALSGLRYFRDKI